MWNRLIAVVEEHARTLPRTAFSLIVREAGDLSAGIFDRKGACWRRPSPARPAMSTRMAESVKHFIAHFGLDAMKPGDAYITNDPWMRTGTDVFMEGLYIPFLDPGGGQGQRDADADDPRQHAAADRYGGDVYSLVAWNDVGCRRLVEMMDELHLDDLDALADHICARSRAAVTAVIARLPKGSWSNAMTTDGFSTCFLSAS
jgi:N-methylhydantoinase B